MSRYNLDETMTLFYIPEINRFKDDFGQVIDWIYTIVNPRDVMLFKEYKDDYVVPDITHSFLVELVWPGYID